MQNSQSKKAKVQTSQRRISQRYTQRTKHGKIVELVDDGMSKFDRVIGKLGDMEEGDRVCLANDNSCTGTVKWIGRYHADPDSEIDEKYYIVGVKLESIKRVYQLQCSYGDLDDTTLAPSTHKDVLFRYFREWLLIEERRLVSGVSTGGAQLEKKSNDGTQSADDTCNGLVHQSPQSKFDRIDLNVNGFHVGSRVKLNTGSVGTVRWIGCYHKKAVKLKDYIVGVELDSISKERWSLTNNGWHDGERLVQSTKNNVKFTKLKELTIETEEIKPSTTSAVAKGTAKRIELYHDGKSAFDRVQHGIAGIHVGDKVYLCTNKTRTGTVKWIGCDHGQASKTDPKDFLVGLEMDEPGKERSEKLTDGTYFQEKLVFSQKKNVMFISLRYCVLAPHSGAKPGTANQVESQPKEVWTTVYTLDRIPIEIYHDGKSGFDRVCSGIAGIQYEDRVYLYSDKTCTGTVKWIGCDHGQGYKKDPKDFLLGVEVDKPKKEHRSTLTDGTYLKERLVHSQKNNVMFVSLQCCTLLKSTDPKLETTNDSKRKPTANPPIMPALDGIPIEIYYDGKSKFDRVRYGIAGIQDGHRVQLDSDETRIGTVKWIGCNHDQGHETNPKDFFVGVEMDRPETEPANTRTYGIFRTERLVDSHKKNVVFTTLKHCTLVKPVGTKPKLDKDKPSTISTLAEIPIEVFHDGESAFVDIRCGDRVQLFSDETRTGTVRWLGMHHSPTAKIDQQEFIAGVEVDDPSSEPEDTLTDGIYCGEQLVNSHLRNVIFAKLHNCALVDRVDTKSETMKKTKTHLKEVWSTVYTLNDIPIEIYHEDKSDFDKVRYGVAGIQNGDRVYVYSHKSRTGIVRWIGCDHGKASMKNPKEFLVGVEMDRPEKEIRGVLTYGSYCREQLVISQKRNVLFLQLQYCTLVADSDMELDMVNDTQTEVQEELSNASTRDGIPIQIYHEGKSAFDRVRYGIGDIQYDDRVYLHSDITRTGTVKWIGCDHCQASRTDPKDFLIGVEVDKPEMERPDMLTDGRYCGEQLVNSQRSNITFTRLQLCSLFRFEKKPEKANNTKTSHKEVWSTVCTSEGIPIEIYDDGKSAFDRVCSGLDGIQYGDKVHLRSDKTRTGTVKWIGCDHGQAAKKDPKDFLVGVEVDKPGKEDPEKLTCGTYYEEQLVVTNNRNIKFTQLKYWVLVEPERKPPTKDTKSQPSETLKRETIPNGYTVELYHDEKSAFDRVCSGIATVRDGDRVQLYSNKSITGTVKWLGCYHGIASATDHNDFFVGVQVDKLEDEYPGHLTDGTFYGERLVNSQNKNVVFTTLQYWALARQTDTKPATTDITQRDNEGPPVHTKDPNLTPEVNNITDPNIYDNGWPMNKSTKQTALLEVNVTDKLAQKPNLSSALSPAAAVHNQLVLEGSASAHTFDAGYTQDAAHMQKSKQYAFVRRDQTTESFTYERPDSLGNVKSVSRQNSTNTQMSLERQHSYDRQEYVDNESRSSIQSVKSPQPLPRQPGKSMQPSDAPVQPLTPSSQRLPNADLRMDLGPISKAEVLSKEVRNVFIENDPHRLLPDVKQKVESEIQKVNTTTHETVRYGTPQPTAAPVPVSSKSTNDYLPMDTEHFAEHDYSWTRDQFDAGFLLRGTATRQDDKTYYTVIVALKPSEKGLADESGEPLEDVVNEVVLPPTHREQYNDFWKGVQGDLNSCYMDASMFAMFSYLTVFDGILYGKGPTTGHSKEEDAKRTEDIRQVLRTQIVNPLRKYGLAQKKGMHELRNLLDDWGLVKGLTGDEKDPEEFLNLLLVNTFATPSPIVLSNGQESHLFHLLAEKQEGMDFPTVQELVERTCLQENFKFSKIPPYLILHLPRFGKDFKMYEKIMPSLELDVTDVISGTSQSCYVCEAVATHECYGCYKDCYNISGSCFCSDCVEDYHRAPTRREHKPQKLVVADKDDGLASAKCVLKLAAVLCIETSHYVTFVASDTTAAARWYFFDSMADREGTTNIPQVREVPEFRKHLSEAKEFFDGVPPLIRRLVKDGYICFYTNPDVPQYNAIDAPLNTTMPGGYTRV